MQLVENVCRRQTLVLQHKPALNQQENQQNEREKLREYEPPNYKNP